jgi:hypothetical protein
VWKRPEDSSVREVVRVFTYGQFPPDWTGWAEIKRPDGTRDLIRTLLRPLPRNGGTFWLCRFCPLLLQLRGAQVA